MKLHMYGVGPQQNGERVAQMWIGLVATVLYRGMKQISHTQPDKINPELRRPDPDGLSALTWIYDLAYQGHDEKRSSHSLTK